MQIAQVGSKKTITLISKPSSVPKNFLSTGRLDNLIRSTCRKRTVIIRDQSSNINILILLTFYYEEGTLITGSNMYDSTRLQSSKIQLDVKVSYHECHAPKKVLVSHTLSMRTRALVRHEKLYHDLAACSSFKLFGWKESVNAP